MPKPPATASFTSEPHGFPRTDAFLGGRLLRRALHDELPKGDSLRGNAQQLTMVAARRAQSPARLSPDGHDAGVCRAVQSRCCFTDIPARPLETLSRKP